MKKFLKICFYVNIFLSMAMLTYFAVVFFATLFDIKVLLNVITSVGSFSTFGLISEYSLFELLGFSIFGFLDNQYFYKAYRTLYNFDKFREITGIKIIPILGIFQTIANAYFIGIFAFVPYALNILSIICLHFYQLSNRKKLISEYTEGHQFIDPTMQEMTLKIGQLRILKSEGKISEEEFISHLNDILENKE